MGGASARPAQRGPGRPCGARRWQAPSVVRSALREGRSGCGSLTVSWFSESCWGLVSVPGLPWSWGPFGCRQPAGGGREPGERGQQRPACSGTSCRPTVLLGVGSPPVWVCGPMSVLWFWFLSVLLSEVEGIPWKRPGSAAPVSERLSYTASVPSPLCPAGSELLAP